MPAKSYPFIDIAVHARVREHFARGDATVLFSPDMNVVLWSNGDGASLFGLPSIYDFIDGGANENDAAYRQMEAAARQLRRSGDKRSFLMRIGAGFRRVPVNASVEMITVRPGETAILFAAPYAGRTLTQSERAARMISGFDDPDTHMAVLDGDGTVLAASGGFAALDMTAQTRRSLVGSVGRDSDWLLKRPIATGKGHLPAAIGKVSSEPALHLLFAVETILGNLDPDDDFDIAEDSAQHIVTAPVLQATDIPAEITPVPPSEIIESIETIEEVPGETEIASMEAVSGITPESEPQPVADDVAGAPTSVDADGNLAEDDAVPFVDDVAGEDEQAQDGPAAAEIEDHGIDSDTPDSVSRDLLAPTDAAEPISAYEAPDDEALSDAEIIEDTLDDIVGEDISESGTNVAQPVEVASSEDVTAKTNDTLVTPADEEKAGDVRTETVPTDTTEPGDEAAVETANTFADVYGVEMSEHAPAAGNLAANTDTSSVEESEEISDGPPANGFVFDRSGRAVRFVWKIDADGRFSEISDEFAMAVGPYSADIAGRSFADLAALHGLDADGTVGELLKRRDTWSGKTLLWPIDGEALRVPVDLAALPTYSRTREFDGFRGFGIVRIADAVIDESASATGIVASPVTDEREDLATPAEPETEERLSSDVASSTDEAEPAGEATTADDAEARIEHDELDVAADHPQPVEDDHAGIEETALSETVPSQTSEETAVENPVEDDPFKGERPALKLVSTLDRSQSDKIVDISNHRLQGSESLTRSEQAAFREIARQLGESFGKRPNSEIVPPSEQPVKASSEEDDTEIAEAAAPAIAKDADDVAAPVETMPLIPPRTSSNSRLTRDMLDNLPIALLVHSGDDLFHANPEFLAMTGYSSLEDLREEGGIDALFASDDDAPDGSMMVIRNDGRLIPVSARLQSIRWEDQNALMMALSTVETSAEQTEVVPSAQEDAEEELDDSLSVEIQALRMETEELHSILETATDGVVVVGSEGEIRSLNRSASALFNYDEAEIRGKPFALLFAHESQRSVIDYLGGLSGHGVASVLNDGREVIGREASGGFIPMFMTMGRLPASNGFCAVIRDITQWKRTEEELRNAKRSAETANAHKSDFLARVSHEIRTPLNAIIGFSDMMASEHFGPIGNPRYIEYASDIGRSGRHVLDIVNDLLDISKIEAGEMELDFTAVELNDAVSEAVALVQPQANGQRVIIRTSLSGSVPNVVADNRSVKQIALNILANAIRFTPSGGQIVVSTAYEANGSVILRIRDTGVGMTRSELEQALKPFRQVTTGARKRGDGTGLGLPLTKAMVEANRALFSISSAPNEGTLVEISFPSQRVLAN